MATLPLYQVDAFAATPFAGNPAAVCVLDVPRADAWQQAVAAEMNLSETAFLLPPGASGAWGLRWFTPATEVRLCGHATLAAAHVLWAERGVDIGRPLRFATLSGELLAEHSDAGIALRLPTATLTPVDVPPELAAALGCAPLELLFDGTNWLLRLEDANALRGLQPDFAAVAKLPVQGLVCTAEGDEPGLDFVSRYFAPAVGIDEDPVTGSAHCALAPYWAGRLGKMHMQAAQLSLRGGRLGVELCGAQTRLTGQAVTVMAGQLHE